ncbi:hypothetical protein FEZ60_02130 [Rhodococcus sp. MS16]|uniref:hypothetical protein n=1 Tax=Rhodococcus sp. MS16 TaxID=2579941 RepID=UPI001561E459|nr:hypothetical protein [Rhodococcus sp. MS16]NRI64348.1 hypothetical protein [Rhodococcus sp. MS16]
MSIQTDYDLDESRDEDVGRHPQTAAPRRGVHWPTVAVSTCAAMVVGIAIPGLVLFGMNLGDQERQVVVTMASPAGAGTAGSTAAAANDGVTVLEPQVPAPAAAPAPAASAAVSAPAAGAAPASPSAPAASAAPAVASAPEEPSTPDVAELNSQLQRGLNSATSDAEVASALEGGAAGVPTVRAVGSALNIAAGIYRWDLTDPVTVTDEVARAQLVTSLPGSAPGQATLKWYWIDGQWKLSNDSLCFLAHRAMATCTVPGNPGGPNGHPL